MTFFKEHLWDIFKISELYNVPVLAGAEMFIQNCLAMYGKYLGAPNLNYVDLNKELYNITDIQHIKNEFGEKLNNKTIYDVLYNCFTSGDKEKFDKLVNEFF